jgi:hypothetical protein
VLRVKRLVLTDRAVPRSGQVRGQSRATERQWLRETEPEFRGLTAAHYVERTVRWCHLGNFNIFSTRGRR